MPCRQPPIAPGSGPGPSRSGPRCRPPFGELAPPGNWTCRPGSPHRLPSPVRSTRPEPGRWRRGFGRPVRGSAPILDTPAPVQVVRVGASRTLWRRPPPLGWEAPSGPRLSRRDDRNPAARRTHRSKGPPRAARPGGGPPESGPGGRPGGTGPTPAVATSPEDRDRRQREWC